MGRKRKTPEISVDNLITNGPEEQYVEVKKTDLKDIALGIAQNKTGYYHLVEIKFNMETGETGEVKILSESEPRSITEERFRIAVANKIFQY